MPNEMTAILTIIAMAIVTYFTRAGGFLLLKQNPSPFVTACLRHLPGTLLTAMVAPLLLKGHPAEWAAAAVTVLVMAYTGSLLVTLTAGVGGVWLFRLLW